jgi:hypothetical protein
VRNGVSIVSLDGLIQAALTGQPYNQQRLGKEAERYSLRISRAKAPDLPEDLHDEICQQAFVELLNMGSEALATHSGRTLFRYAVLAAIRSVRASYAPPGERTRTPGQARAADLPASLVAAEDIDRIPDARSLDAATVAEGEFAYLDFDRLPDPRQRMEFRRVEAKIVTDAALQHAAPEVSRVLRLVHVEGHTLEAAALAESVSRFALKRRIDAFCAVWQAAA